MQSSPCSVLSIVIRGKRVVSRGQTLDARLGKRARWQENHFQLITPCTMDVNARHVNDYIWEAVVYVPITWILYRTELGLRFCSLVGRWWNTGSGRVEHSGPVGLSKRYHVNFAWDVSAIHIQLKTKLLRVLIVPSERCNNRNTSNKFSPFIYFHALIFCGFS